jgi:hypothetical protein
MGSPSDGDANRFSTSGQKELDHTAIGEGVASLTELSTKKINFSGRRKNDDK